MIIECSTCGAKYKYDESKLEGTAGKKVKCSKCKGVIEIINPNAEAQKARVAPQKKDDSLERTYTSAPVDAPAEAPRTTTKVKREALLGDAVKVGAESAGKMPDSRKISLAVISGSNSGEIHQINKTHASIGRADADIIISDLESSRHHASIDVMGDRVVLRDLNSTNGTFVNEQKISATNLENHSEFRIGTTVFMLIITDLD
jgi:predicted Zn finger-like uncharacterized protein